MEVLKSENRPFDGFYDIILGDFGRLAAVRYVQILTDFEQALIRDNCGFEREFYNEMRRIMFVLCCEIEWFKRNSIREELNHFGRITRQILIGLGDSRIADEFVRSGSKSVATLIDSAITKGYKKIRIYVPCNGLSEMVRDLVAESLRELYGNSVQHEMRKKGRVVLKDGSVLSCESVPQRVAATISRKEQFSTALILGTRGVNDQYRKFFEATPIKLFELNDADYEAIETAIVASISGDQNWLLSVKDVLNSGLVQRFFEFDAGGVIIEACTDFEFGLGKSSLEIFAKELVSEAYQE